MPQTGVEELTARLLAAIDPQGHVKDMTAVSEVVAALETMQITAEHLKVTRLGKHINSVRRQLTDTNKSLAKRMKKLVKSWQQLLQARPSNGLPPTLTVPRSSTPTNPLRSSSSSPLVPHSVSPVSPSKREQLTSSPVKHDSSILTVTSSTPQPVIELFPSGEGSSNGASVRVGQASDPAKNRNKLLKLLSKVKKPVIQSKPPAAGVSLDVPATDSSGSVHAEYSQATDSSGPVRTQSEPSQATDSSGLLHTEATDSSGPVRTETLQATDSSGSVSTETSRATDISGPVRTVTSHVGAAEVCSQPSGTFSSKNFISVDVNGSASNGEVNQKQLPKSIMSGSPPLSLRVSLPREFIPRTPQTSRKTLRKKHRRLKPDVIESCVVSLPRNLIKSNSKNCSKSISNERNEEPLLEDGFLVSILTDNLTRKPSQQHDRKHLKKKSKADHTHKPVLAHTEPVHVSDAQEHVQAEYPPQLTNAPNVEAHEPESMEIDETPLLSNAENNLCDLERSLTSGELPDTKNRMDEGVQFWTDAIHSNNDDTVTVLPYVYIDGLTDDFLIS